MNTADSAQIRCCQLPVELPWQTGAPLHTENGVVLVGLDTAPPHHPALVWCDEGSAARRYPCGSAAPDEWAITQPVRDGPGSIWFATYHPDTALALWSVAGDGTPMPRWHLPTSAYPLQAGDLSNKLRLTMLGTSGEGCVCGWRYRGVRVVGAFGVGAAGMRWQADVWPIAWIERTVIGLGAPAHGQTALVGLAANGTTRWQRLLSAQQRCCAGNGLCIVDGTAQQRAHAAAIAIAEAAFGRSEISAETLTAVLDTPTFAASSVSALDAHSGDVRWSVQVPLVVQSGWSQHELVVLLGTNQHGQLAMHIIEPAGTRTCILPLGAAPARATIIGWQAGVLIWSDGYQLYAHHATDGAVQYLYPLPVRLEPIVEHPAQMPRLSAQITGDVCTVWQHARYWTYRIPMA